MMAQRTRSLKYFDLARRLLCAGFMNAAGLGFAAYIAIICYPAIRASSDLLMNLRTGQTSMTAIGEGNLQIAVPAMFGGLLLFARHGATTIFRNYETTLVSLLIFSSLILTFSLAAGITAYTSAQLAQYLMTVVAFVLCLCFWQAPPAAVDNALAMAFLSLTALLLAGALFQGFHDYRWVGLIHPNHYARYAFVALVLHSVLMRRVSLVVFILAFLAAYMVSSRTLMVGIIFFAISYFCLTLRGPSITIKGRRAQIYFITLTLIAAAIVLTTASFFMDSERLFSRLANDLAIFDASRGVSSGFTGRSDSWNGFFDSVPNFVLYGYGFRSARYDLHAVHSGILSYFIDFGLLLGGSLLAAVVARASYLILIGRRTRHNRMLICGLAIITTLIIQCFEPDNFNIGFIGSFFFMLVLAYSPPTNSRANGAT